MMRISFLRVVSCVRDEGSGFVRAFRAGWMEMRSGLLIKKDRLRCHAVPAPCSILLKIIVFASVLADHRRRKAVEGGIGLLHRKPRKPPRFYEQARRDDC